MGSVSSQVARQEARGRRLLLGASNVTAPFRSRRPIDLGDFGKVGYGDVCALAHLRLVNLVRGQRLNGLRAILREGVRIVVHDGIEVVRRIMRSVRTDVEAVTLGRF